MSQVAGWITHRYLKFAVIVFWLVVVALLGPLAGKLTGAQDNDAKSWLPANAESTEVLDVAAGFVSSNTIPAVIVYERPAGLTPEDLEAVAADAAEFGTLDTLDGEVIGPIPSEDGEAVQIIVPLDLGSDGWNLAADAVDDLRATAEDGPDGLDVYVTGPAGSAADSSAAFEGIDGTLLYAAVAVVIVILLITYRSPILWLLPVISAGVALTVSQALIYLLADNYDLTVNAQSAGILTVLVFGAGTDYALLLVARYREELRKHGDRHEAMALALHRASPAIIASGATVAIGMLCLLFATMNSTAGLGPVAAVGVGVAVLVMLTLLPALLVTCGRWIFWPRAPKLGDDEPSEHGFWARVGGRIERRPRATWIGTSAILAVACLGIVALNATGLTTEESFRGTQPSIEGEKVLAAHFPGGAGSPVAVIANADQATPDRGGIGLRRRRGHRPDEHHGARREGRSGVPRGHPDLGARTATTPTTRSTGSGPPCTRCPTPTPWSAAPPPSTSTSSARPRTTTPDHPDRPPGRVPDPDGPAPGGRRTAHPHRDGRAVLRRGPRRQRADLQVRLRLRRRGHVVPAVRLRVPGRARDRLQHLPHDPGPGGSHTPRAPRGALVGLAATGGVITRPAWSSPGRSRCSARCLWWRSRRSGSRWRSACSSTPWWSGPCWSRR